MPSNFCRVAKLQCCILSHGMMWTHLETRMDDRCAIRRVTDGFQVGRVIVGGVTHWLLFFVFLYSISQFPSPNLLIFDPVGTMPLFGYEKLMKFSTNQKRVSQPCFLLPICKALRVGFLQIGLFYYSYSSLYMFSFGGHVSTTGGWIRHKISYWWRSHIVANFSSSSNSCLILGIVALSTWNWRYYFINIRANVFDYTYKRWRGNLYTFHYSATFHYSVVVQP